MTRRMFLSIWSSDGAIGISDAARCIILFAAEKVGIDVVEVLRRSNIRCFLSQMLNSLVERVTDSDEPRNSLPPGLRA